MSMLDKSVDASAFQQLKGWLLPNDSRHCKRAGNGAAQGFWAMAWRKTVIFWGF
ncbi:hypothetical protein LP416_13905 [Polaromonas sp. P2-4]|nr:hypothetical protein LP416_13905 [Polaromonas sp. P2-4]